jgi:ATP-dependent Lhr-like helicase
LWIAAENWPVVQAAFSDARAEPPLELPERLLRNVERTDGWIALVRGRVEHSGPISGVQIAEFLNLEEGFVTASLEALEGQGTVLRGTFTEATQNGAAAGGEWCDRRLLARIHRLTLRGLRERIQPVEPRAFLHFLTRHHHLVPENQWGGAVGVREAIAQLQGFELPAGAWERRVLSARIGEYDPQWLDHLFLAGEVVWGRLNSPRRDADEPPSSAALSRVVPISILLREELPTLLPPEREPPTCAIRSAAEQVLAELTARGALFFGELKTATGLLPSHLEEALRELAALGLVTSDAYAAVRKIVDGAKPGRGRRRTERVAMGVAAPIGRWSLFPGAVSAASREVYLNAWCRQLLARWGVLFRDLLARETSAPSWQDLVGTLRRLELRGEVRGGRFVSQVAGEQYALPTCVDHLRQARQEIEAGGELPWLVLSAADPLNLVGIVTPGARVPATHRNALVLSGGRLIATREAGQFTFHEPVDRAVEWEMRRAMTLGHRPAAVSAEISNQRLAR